MMKIHVGIFRIADRFNRTDDYKKEIISFFYPKVMLITGNFITFKTGKKVPGML